MDDELDPEVAKREDRTLDLESLKALSHPLRLQIFDVLSVYGPATASGLAERLGESSGATSYHLRQLEKHGFVREVEGRGSARERWWERVPGGINVFNRETVETPVGRAATDIVSVHFQQNSERLLTEFIVNAVDTVSEEWADASSVLTANLRLTQPELRELLTLWQNTIDPWINAHRGRREPGSRPVQVQFNAFPIIDGDVTPETPENGDVT